MGCGLSKSEPFKAVSRPQLTRQFSSDTCNILHELEVIPHYSFKEVLGKGSFAKVFLWESPETKHQFAVKAIPKGTLPFSKLLEEIAILSKVDHPNIVKYINAFQSEKYLYVVMEYCSGLSLGKRIVNEEKLSEREAAGVMKNLLCAINHCHHLGIIHRDLKPDNILYSSNGTLKIIDFGLSMHEDEYRFERVAGTRLYIAPEIVRTSKFTKACDVWSLGVTMHILLTGSFPVGGNTVEDFFTNVLAFKKPDFTKPEWALASKEAKDLIKKMLEPDYEKRISAGEALRHPWFSRCEGKSGESVEVLKALDKYREASEMKKKILNALAKSVSDDDIEKFNAVFLEIDKNKTGMITCSDLEEYLSKMEFKVDAKTLDHYLKSMNQREKAHINYSEFIAAAIATKAFLTDEKLRYLFKLIDIKQQASKGSRNYAARRVLAPIRLVREQGQPETIKMESVTFDQFKCILLS